MPNTLLPVRLPGYLEPEETPDTSWFWDGVRRHEFLVAACRACGQRFLPPAPGCAACGSPNLTTEQASGRGFVLTWTVIHRAMHELFQDVPYTVVLAELEEGARVFGRLLDADDHPATDGLPVQLEFVTAGPDGAPYWAFRARPLDSGQAA